MAQTKNGNTMNKITWVLLATLSCVMSYSRSHADEPRQPFVVAHRGLLVHAPENTLANFRACLELRIGFEFDVQRTKDDALVCVHDDTLNRTTNGTGRVSERTLAEIRTLDAGSWFDPKFAGERIPTIDEVLRLVAEYRQHEILIAIDLKAEAVEAEVVKLAERHHVVPRLLFIGRTISEPKVRERIKHASVTAQTAAVANTSEEFPQTLAAPNADWVYFRYIPIPAQIEAVHRAGKRAFIAGPTVAGHQPTQWRQAAEVGLDAILTDYPLELRALLRQNQPRR